MAPRRHLDTSDGRASGDDVRLPAAHANPRFTLPFRAMTDAHGRGTAAVSWGEGRIDLFWVDFDGALIHQAFEGGAWDTAESLGGSLASGPAVTAWAVGQMEVFAVMQDGGLSNRYWDGVAWHAWEPLGGDLDPSETPAASSFGPDRLDVFARGRDGRTWHRWWDGSRWVPWEQLDR